MAEPEGLLFDGARLATCAVRELWRRAGPPAPGGPPGLSGLRRRLELFVEASVGRGLAILPADPPPAPTWLTRLVGRAPRHRGRRPAMAATDGRQIWLPRTLTVAGDEARAAAMYRLLALEQAARIVRGTVSGLPAEGGDPLERDLYLLAEAVAVDRMLDATFPGLGAELRAARGAALAARAPLDGPSALERTMEELLRRVLAAGPSDRPDGVPLAAAAHQSRAWARAVSSRLRSEHGGSVRRRWREPLPGRYRGIAAVELWGEVVTPVDAPDRPSCAEGELDRREPLPRRARLRYRPRVRPRRDDENDGPPGTWMVRADPPMESVEDPMGLRRPLDRDPASSPEDLADSLSELPEASLVRIPGTPREILEADTGPLTATPAAPRGRPTTAGVLYPEWDYRSGAYRPGAVAVRTGPATPGAGQWVHLVMARHAALVRQVRRRFDGLRPRRARLGRQVEGPEVDLSAYVMALADRRMGRSGDDRFYVANPPARRELALALLVDVSASTDGWVGGSQRIIDVEKEALIVLLEALDALGDRHLVLAFSSQGSRDVRVTTIKAADERAGAVVRRRVAGLEPDGYTRVGAALRHACALLGREPARHHLLLVLSDGKPNDIDEYGGRYGVEDARQAVAEARRQGIVPFCLAVDRDTPPSVPSIFGRGGHALLRCSEHLPATLVEVVRRLLLRTRS